MEINQLEGSGPDPSSSVEKASAVMQESMYTLPMDSGGNSLVKIEPNSSMEGVAIEGIKIKEEFIPEEQEAEESFSFISYEGADCVKQEGTDIETPTIEVTSVTSLADQVDLKSSSQHAGTNFETNIQITDELYPGEASPQEYSIAQESIIVKEEVVFTQENGPSYTNATENCLAAMRTEVKTECDPQENGSEWAISEEVDNDSLQGVNCNKFNLRPPNSAASAGSNGVFYVSSMAVKGGEKFVSPNNIAIGNNFSPPLISTQKLDLALSAILTESETNSTNLNATENCEDHFIPKMKKRSYHLSYLPGYRMQRNKFDSLCSEMRSLLKRKQEIKHSRKQKQVAISAPYPKVQLISCDFPYLLQNEALEKIHPAVSLVPSCNSAFLDERVKVGSDKQEGKDADFNNLETPQISNGASNSRQICKTSKSDPADNLTVSHRNFCKVPIKKHKSSNLRTFSFPINHNMQLISCGTSTMSLKEVVLNGKHATALYIKNSKSNFESLKRKLKTEHAVDQQKLALLSKPNTKLTSDENALLSSNDVILKCDSAAELAPVSPSSSNGGSKMEFSIKKKKFQSGNFDFQLTSSEVGLSSQNSLIPGRDLVAELIPNNSECLKKKSEPDRTNEEEEIIVSTDAGTEIIPNNLAKLLENEVILESDIESIKNLSGRTFSVDSSQSQSCTVHFVPFSEPKSEKNVPNILHKPISDKVPSFSQSSSVFLSTKSVFPRKSSFTKTTPSILRKLVSSHSHTAAQSRSVLPSTNYAHLRKTKVTKSILLSKPIFSSPVSVPLSTNLIKPQKSETTVACDSTAELDSSHSPVHSSQRLCSSYSESNCIPLPTNTNSFSSTDTPTEETLCSPESSDSSFTSRNEHDFERKPQSDSTAEPTHDFSSPASNNSSASCLNSSLVSENLVSTAEQTIHSAPLSSDSLPTSSNESTSLYKLHSEPTTQHNPNAAPPACNSTSVSRRKSALICKRDSEPTLFCLFSDSSHHENRTFKSKRKTRVGVLKDLFARKYNFVPILTNAEASKWITVNMLTCRRCETSFETVESCVKHLEDHLWDKYVCKSCPRSFQCENLYKEHLKTHACSRFVCQSCNASFWSLRAYEVHSQRPCVKSIKCSLCSSYFDPEDYECHLADVHFKK